MRRIHLAHLIIVSAAVSLVTFAQAEEQNTSKKPAQSIPTFHCLSLYWSPEGGELSKKVLVKFRESTETVGRLIRRVTNQPGHRVTRGVPILAGERALDDLSKDCKAGRLSLRMTAPSGRSKNHVLDHGLRIEGLHARSRSEMSGSFRLEKLIEDFRGSPRAEIPG